MSVHASSLLPAIVALPLIGALINGLFGWKFNRRTVHGIAVGVMAVAFALSMRAFYALAQIAETHVADPQISYKAWTWAVSGLFQFDVAFYLDPLSALLLLVVTGVGTLVHIFSMGYMSEEPSYARYFAYLNLFVFSMLLLILGKNLFMMFVGWEGVGVCSYLLIGFWFTDDDKAQAGQKAFVVNRVGDFGFVIGLILVMFHAGGSTDYDVLKWVFSAGEYGPFHDPYTLTAACLLLFVGACGKSAQIPLYVWLPDAMAGPTPVSALIHAATMVTAGVYMIARLSFMFTLSPAAMGVVATVGALTALFAALMALTQRDIKKVLAYSTVSQLGYMVLAVGVGAYVAGVFHLMTHAFFKALLFLGAGSVIHAMHHEQDIFKMGGLKAKMPITRITFLIACLAIAGFPFLSGYYSKDEILWEVHSRGHAVSIPENAHAAYADEDGLLIGGRHGVVLHTAGDGNWTQSRLPVTVAMVREVRQAVPSNVRAFDRDTKGGYWAVSDHASLFRSADGKSWRRVFVPPSGPQPGFKAVTAIASNDVWAVGEQGWAVHYDGKQVRKVVVPTKTTLRAVAGKSKERVYAGGNGGTLLEWNGKRWNELQSPTSATITDLAFVGDTLWASTSQGVLLKLDPSGRFDKVSVQPDGVQVQSLNGLVRGADQVIAVGKGIFGPDGPRAGVFIMNADGTFQGLPGRTDVVLQAGSVIGGTIHAHGDGRHMQLTASDGSEATLSSASSVSRKPAFHHFLWVIGVLTAVMTAFYMFRLYFLTFEGETRADKQTWDHAHESPLSMTFPLMVLAVLSIAGGWWGHELVEWMAPVFKTAHSRLNISPEHTWVAKVPLVALFGIALAYVWYGKASKAPASLAERFPRAYNVLYNKFYVDEIYAIVVLKPYAQLAKFLHRVVDVFLIDTMLVRAVGFVAKHIGRFIRVIQTGNVQHYAVFVAVGLMLLALLVGV